MTLEELLADPGRQGRICGYIKDCPVYHGDKLVSTDPDIERVIKGYSSKKFLFAFYSHEYTIWNGEPKNYITTRIPGYPYRSEEDEHPIFASRLAFHRNPIESDPEYEGLFI